MLSIVYWDGNFPDRYQLGMNIATLVGSMIGQVIFGFLADRYGRRKMYGLELIVTIAASLGFATASTGVNGSMSLVALLIFWRLVMGVGIGADYPLSAVITAEFAPTKYRARMLAAVFFFQPLGQLIAVLMAFAATAGFRSYISLIPTDQSCSVKIFNTDVAGIECARTVDRAWRLVAGLGAVPAVVAMVFRLTIPESVYYILDIKNDSNEAMHAKDYFGSREDLGHIDSESVCSDEFEHTPKATVNGNHIGTGLQLPQPALQPDSHGQRLAEDFATSSIGPTVEELEDPHPSQASRADLYKYLFVDGNWTDLFATAINWMLLDFTFYLLGVNSSSFIPRMFGQNIKFPLLPPYNGLISNERHIMESTSIGALIGSAMAILAMHFYSRKRIQMWGFLILGALFIVVGALYVTLPSTHAHVAIVVFYGICQLFYNLGPNTTTFIIPAEAFPTRYRCTLYGISAASGKLGSVLGQIVVTKVQNNKRLGITLILFVIVMLVGAALSRYLTPETSDIHGRSRKLEDLAKGKSHRRDMEREERDAEESRLDQLLTPTIK
ncbi:MAG: hypothetical protein ASARMPREDX12_006839, partial [Alectoria sarmentosa]